MSSWTPEKQRAKYARLRAEGRCVQCAGKMLPEWGAKVHCPVCAEARNESSRRYNKTKQGRSRDKEWHRRARSSEAYLDRERARQRGYKLAKKLAGICRDCPAPSLPDNIRCEECRDIARARGREYMRCQRLGIPYDSKKVPGKPKAKTVNRGRPARPANVVAFEPAPKEETILQRILRVASRFDEFTNADLQDATGMDGELLSTKIYKLKRSRLIEMVNGQQGATDSTYRVTRRAA